MADGICSVCSKGGAKRCSKCKMQYYCSVECQTADWKSHRKICKEIAKTIQLKESMGPKTGITGMSPELTELFSHMLSRTSSVDRTATIPEYHEEYRRLYPAEEANYQKLRDSWFMAKTQSLEGPPWEEQIVEGSRDYGYMDYVKRWHGFGPDVKQFLATNPQPGDIFTTKAVPPYGTLTTTSGQTDLTIYQTMRNAAVQPVEFQLGKTYIYMGFVDMFNLLMGSFIKDSDESQQPLIFVGVDKSEVVIARALVIYDMILHEASAASILQVWFSTGWNAETQKEFKEACRRIVAQDNPTEAERVLKLLNFWNDVTEMPVKSVQPLWRQHVRESQLEPLNNLESEKDRTDYARYIFTGQIFGKNDEDYIYGNVTMFCLPKEFNNYFRQDQNFFTALSMENFRHQTSLLDSVTDQVTAGLSRLTAHIKSRRIVCKFLFRDLNVTSKTTLEEIKEMNATLIDWSNIPDYLPIADFFTMAKACGGAATVHALHSMNWSLRVFGVSLIDYKDKYTVFRELKKEMVERYKKVKKRRPFLRQDRYLLYFMSVADFILSAKYRQRYIDYFFKGRNVAVSEATCEEFNPFERCLTCFFLSFTFKK